MSVAISSQVWVLLLCSARAIVGVIRWRHMSMSAISSPPNFETAFIDKLDETLPPKLPSDGSKPALVNALACELPPVDNPRREKHIEFNKRLISKSHDLLAPVNGTERFVTLGCGHTVAFWKTAQLASKTPEAKLADADGSG